MRPEDTMFIREGEKNVNYQGVEMQIVTYRKSSDIDVLFLNGCGEVVKTRYEHFKSGRVKAYSAIVGKDLYSKSGAHCSVVGIEGRKWVYLEYDNGEVIKYRRNNIGDGKVVPEQRTIHSLTDKTPIPNHNGYFADRNGGIYNNKGWKLHQSNQGDYLVVSLPREGKIRNVTVHRLIATTFLPNPLNKEEVNHKDGNKHNNCVGNLEWATTSENQKHKYRVLGYTHRGENNTQAKLTNEDVLCILEESKKGSGYNVIAEKFDVSVGTIYDILKGRSWNHLTGFPCKKNRVNKD